MKNKLVREKQINISTQAVDTIIKELIKGTNVHDIQLIVRDKFSYEKQTFKQLLIIAKTSLAINFSESEKENYKGLILSRMENIYSKALETNNLKIALETLVQISKLLNITENETQKNLINPPPINTKHNQFTNFEIVETIDPSELGINKSEITSEFDNVGDEI